MLEAEGVIVGKPITIFPYLLDRIWVFDDPRAGLKEEAFVLGMTEMIYRAVPAKGIPNAAQGFCMIFDAAPFGHDVELTVRNGEVAQQAQAQGILVEHAPFQFDPRMLPLIFFG